MACCDIFLRLSARAGYRLGKRLFEEVLAVFRASVAAMRKSFVGWKFSE